jgi:methylenetetrahydrofolate--tRNA-(uracil-5-)-methyltransferase
LAGCEAAWQLAHRGVDVELWEARPLQSSPAHETDLLAELVCSNSLRGAVLTSAVGVLKEEMRRLGSLILAAADATAVPAGRALAVDRKAFASLVTDTIVHHPKINLVRRTLQSVPQSGPVILATGPLTTAELAADLASLTGDEGLAYYDAIAPVLDGASLDRETIFVGSRYDGGDDYLNIPLDETQYRRFVDDLLAADVVPAREFEDPQYFEGCLPVEVMARRGYLTLAHGPMKPVGLTDPRTGRRPFAVIQLRREDRAGTAFNMVGFQTRMRQGEQERVLRSLPGLGQAQFLRHGSVHRNTFVNAPQVLGEQLALRQRPDIYLAGQLTGVEGYVESAACGLLVGMMVSARCTSTPWPAVPEESAMGGLLWHLRGGAGGGRFQPSNVTWAMLPPPPRAKKRHERRRAAADRALAAIEAWRDALPPPLRVTDVPSLPANH